MSDKKVVLFRGPVLTQSGYGVHARQIVRWLLSRQNIDLHIEVLPWGDTPWILNGDMYDGLIGKIFTHTSPPSRKADVTFQLQLPNEWDASLGDKNIGITAGVESDRCNPVWQDACNKMTHVIVPSEHTKASLMMRNSVITTPVTVIPEAFCDAIIDGAPREQFPDFSTKFNFMIFGQLTSPVPEVDRKNTFNTLKWTCESLSGDKDVGIVLKTNAGRNTKIDRLYVGNLLKGLLAQVRKGAYPRVHLVHGDVPDSTLNSLYRHKQVKALISLTRGEGFGLPTLEAASAGLPVIATGWSGHLDFLRQGKFVEVDYSLAPLPKGRVDGQIFVQGAQWAEPSESDFKKRLTKFRESPDVPREWSLALAKKLQATHSYGAIYARYDSLFGDIL